MYPLTAFFRMFGVDWPQLRLFSTLYAALGLAAVLTIAVRFLSPWAVAFVGALVAIDGVYFHYARAGLLEPAVNTWLAACMLALILAQHRASWLIVAHWLLALAFFTKQAALVAVPAVLFASAYVLWKCPTRERLWIAGNLLLIVLLAGLYIANSDYQRAAEHNVNHVLMGSDAPENLKYRGLG
ncbi:MAG TPA: glycosyltransferase family 39 protein, partial [Polyangiales bacterium]|nr:glycosyltransferase family 39 protein [Polyangiales bacterium]